MLKFNNLWRGAVIPGVHLALLSVSENEKNIDKSFISVSELDEIGKYKRSEDKLKRLIARSYLFEYLYSTYGLTDFSVVHSVYSRPELAFSKDISFSFSYSGDYVLIAVGRNIVVGVDIEHISNAIEINKIGPMFMSNAELECMNKISDESSCRRFFFSVFSLKESILKAIGMGFYLDPRQFDVSAATDCFFENNRYRAYRLGCFNNELMVSCCVKVN